MADISKITLPSGDTYDIKDATARAIAGGAIKIKGVTTTALTDESTTNPITIDGESYTAIANDAVFYNKKEFVFDGTKWHEFGDMSGLGSLAYKNSASFNNNQISGTVSKPTFTGAAITSTGKFTPAGSVSVSTDTTSNKTATVAPASSGTVTYTPEGSVSAPTISVATAGSTTTIKDPTSKTVVTDMSVADTSSTTATGELVYCTVSNETLVLKKFVETTGDSITTTDVTVKTGDATYSATAPTFTGTGVRLVTGNIPVPETYTATFTGTEGSVSVSGTTSGEVSQPTFTPADKTITVS